MASSEAIAAMLGFADEFFESNFIRSREVKERVCRMMLESGDLFSVTDHKFSIETFLESMSKEPVFSDTRPRVYINSGLSSTDRNSLMLANPGVLLKFEDTTPMPHGMAYAQRLIHTRELMSGVANLPMVLDIGGNYKMHAASEGKASVHCCTQKAGWREFHRQAQRDVYVDEMGYSVDYCTNGVENCDVQAEQGISVHVLPEIDPDDWVKIFRRHVALKYVACKFHYDPLIATGATSGYMPHPQMHWHVENELVVFHFDMDSSFDYRHRRDWLVRYARPWLVTAPDWPYVLYYSVDVLSHGVLSSTFTKLEKATVGYHSPHPSLQWLGGETNVSVPVPRFDPELGRSVHDPRAYKVVHIDVPETMFNFVFMKGVANDTERPDTPVSRASIKMALRVFNQNRSLNGVELTSRVSFSSETIDYMADGVYAAVVSQIAYDKVVLGKFTDQMRRLQRKWGHESLLWLLGRQVQTYALLPFIFLSDEIGEAVDLMALHMRSGRGMDVFLTRPENKVPYYSLGSMDLEVTPEFAQFTHQKSQPPAPSEPEIVDTVELRKEYYHAFRDEIPRAAREALEKELFDGHVPERIVTGKPVFEEDDSDEFPSRSETYDEVTMNRDAWIREFENLQKLPHSEHAEVTTGDLAEVHKYDRHAVLEYAMHCFDLDHCVREKCLEFLSRHFRAEVPLRDKMAEDNLQLDIGAVALKVEDGKLMGASEDTTYDVVLDPITKNFLQVYRRNGEQCVGKTSVGVVYATNAMRIFNSQRLGLVAKRIYDEGFDISHVPVHLVDGIAGAGKTKKLMETVTPRDIFCTGPRDAAEGARAWAKTQAQFKGMDTEVDARFRTIDSSLLHSKRLGETFFADEGLMLHYGCLVVKAVQSRAKTIRVSGDNAQIGLIDRGAGYGALKYSVNKVWTTVEYLNTSLRMPGDVTCLIRKFYPSWRAPLINTCSPIRRSLKLTVIPDPKSPLMFQTHPCDTVVVLLRGDKFLYTGRQGFEDGKVAKTSSTGGTPVLTVHEAQGATYLSTAARRLNKFSSDIFKSPNHQYVWISRHEILHELRTVCTTAQCAYSALVQQGIDLSEDQIDSAMVVSPDEVYRRKKAGLEEVAKYTQPLTTL